MNAKLLFAATVALSALSLASTVAMADSTGPLTRAEVEAQTIHGGTTSRGEIYGEPTYRAAPSTVSRASVVSELVADRATRPYGDIGERYDEAPVTYAPSLLARAEVKADVRHAIADGRLPRNGENDENVTTASASRAAHQHIALASR